MSSLGSKTGISFPLIVILWTLLLGVIGGWQTSLEIRAQRGHALTAARYSLGKDMSFRHWGVEHGGVYVPVSERTAPNPYLFGHPERDILTPSDRRLTLMNPAYMMRQFHEMFGDLYGTQGHITSLELMRPENAPDPWERQALLAFERGVREWIEVTDIAGEPYLRLMQPFEVVSGCLKCHTDQGYAPGDVLGGISVSVPWAPYQNKIRTAIAGYVGGYGLLWAFGLVLIGYSRTRLDKHLSARHEAEGKLAHSYDLMRYIVQHDPSAISVLDRNLCYLYCSDRYLADYGINEKSLVGRSHYEVFPEIPARWRTIHQRALGGETFSCEEEVFVRDAGKVDYVRWHCLPWREGDGGIGGIILYTEVITPLVEGRHTLRDRTLELERRNVELEQLSFTLSHDLRTPLVTIENFLGFLEQDLARRDEQAIARDIGHIRGAARRMNHLLDGLKHLLQVEVPNAAPMETPVAELVDEALTLVAEPININGTHIKLSVGDLCLYGNRQRLVQIWNNLIDNAVKFSADRQPPMVEIGVETLNGETVFFVRDNGVGIEPEYQHTIFRLFDKLNTHVDGTGLGLALVKRLVEFYGGRIWVESEGLGHGSSFFFTLPQATK